MFQPFLSEAKLVTRSLSCLLPILSKGRFESINKNLKTNTPLSSSENSKSYSSLELSEAKLIEKYRVFSEPSQCDDWSNQHFQLWKNQLSKEEIITLKEYTWNTYKQINRYLRHESSFSCSGEILKKIGIIQNAIKKCVIPENIIVFRGVSWNAFQQLDVHEYPNLVNKVFFDRGFVSSSLLKSHAEQFGTGILMKISVPKGTSGAMISLVSLHGRHESELLLNCNQYMKITKIQKYDTKVFIESEIITQKYNSY